MDELMEENLGALSRNVKECGLAISRKENTVEDYKKLLQTLQNDVKALSMYIEIMELEAE